MGSPPSRATGSGSKDPARQSLTSAAGDNATSLTTVCDRCSVEKADRRESSTYASIHDIYREISLNRSCAQCRAISHAATRFLLSMERTTEISMISIDRDLGSKLWQRILVIAAGANEVGSLEFCSYQGVERRQPPPSAKTLPDFEIFSAISPSTDSFQALNWARKRLDECETHGSCRQSRRSDDRVVAQRLRYPSRLLNIEDMLSLTSGTVTLWEDFPRSPEYVCLSYCWGDTQHFVLNQDTCGELAHGVLASRLPKTLAEAMFFARQLGYRWMWIDALCIRQDKLADNLGEIRHMAEIYARGALTLAIIKSKHTDAGCLSKSSPDYVGFSVDGNDYEVASPATESHGISIRRVIPQTDTWIASKGDAESQPLLQRAWAFQELFQSTRILLFTTHEIKWRCLELAQCECGNQGPDSAMRALDRKDEASGAFQSALQLENLDQITVKEKWHNLLPEYCRRQLTFPFDRERAIMGLGRRFEQAANDKLVAGIWKSPNTLHICLLWFIYDPSIDVSQRRNVWPNWSWLPSQRMNQWPSWSWLSAIPGDGARLWYEPERVGGEDPRKTSFEFVEREPPIAVSSESCTHDLQACGRLIPAKLTVKFDELFRYNTPGIELGLPVAEAHETDFYPDYDCSAALTRKDIRLLYVRRLHRSLWFIALIPVTNKTDVFERVGVVNMTDMREEEDACHSGFPCKSLCLSMEDFEERTILIV